MSVFSKIITALLLCFPFYLNAQQIEKVEGEILVMVSPGFDLQETLKNAYPLETKAGLTATRITSNMGIWQINFKNTGLLPNPFLNRLKETPGIVIVQFNHKIKYRIIPDDIKFNDQWSLFNTGQSGGVTGADCGVTDAWEITTGGLTATGDTIVIAMIDDGMDTSHPDLYENLWKNRSEIPNNKIDEDTNGFVDDYNGWDFYNNDDKIYAGFHGTAITSIIAAKGNNQIGMAGINWDIKILPVAADVDEASAVAAYDYVLGFRKRYNESNGAYGGFVVATNSSWGIDFGQPDSMPLWCAMYDSLGKVGIINVAATMNLDEDVDAVGDMPSSCPSDFLITVTNTNRNDLKVKQAAYGLKTIDIGAPGEDVVIAFPNNAYNTGGGTSYATPHVTGAIGLLYSASCKDLMKDAKLYPDSIALEMKRFILEGVDPNPDLKGITVSGGRLNIYQSLLLAENYGTCILASVNNIVKAHAGEYGILDIFPNPANQAVTIEYNNLKAGSNRFLISNALGQIVAVKTDKIQGPGIHSTQIDVSGIPTGLYFISIENGLRQSGRNKLIITH
jgi:subtilisin family serine protease